ncbi:MAG: hypothetical protein Kow00124_25620 [Anaerolineae bacterium]
MIKIGTNSGVSLPQALIQPHDIRIAAGTLLFDGEQVLIADIPPSVGTNTGPRALGLPWYYEEQAGT